MALNKNRRSSLFIYLTTSLLLLAGFQNCSAPKNFETAPEFASSLAVCNGISCDLTPLTAKPAVTTILMALGDEANNQLVVDGVSSQLIAEVVVRYTSPKTSPRILVVRDSASGGETSQDTRFVTDKLLARFDVTLLDEPSTGLTDNDLAPYDVVWFNNPGAPMGVKASRDALMRFKGGVVLQGDDLSRGSNFALDELTGLKFIDNGTSVTCSDGRSYLHDDNNGQKYRVEIDASKIPGVSQAAISFRYGNDIDNTVPARSDLEILASAKGGPESCVDSRPAVVRYFKAG